MPQSATGLTNTALESGPSGLHAFKPLLLGLAAVAVALALLNGLMASLGDSPQFSFTLAGSFALYLATRPARRELIVTVGLGLALRLAYGATYGIKPYFGSPVISIAGFVGVASLLMLAYTAVRRRRLAEFETAAYFPFVSIVVGFILPVTNRLSPATFDTHLLAADSATGFQPSFLLGRLIGGRPVLWSLTSTVYYALPFAVALLCAAQFGKRPGEVRRLLWLFGFMSAVGFCLYAVCPATGPVYAFREWFPFRTPDVAHLSLAALSVPGAARNAIPSLHFSTALLVFWNTRVLRRAARIAAGLFLAGTAFAILALGEHYLTDIVVAVPFSLMFQAAFSSATPADSTWRYGAMWSSAGLVALWLLILRFGVQPLTARPAVTCVAFATTVGFSIWMWAELCKRRLLVE